MSLKGKPHVADIRTMGLVAGIDLTRSRGRPASALTTPWRRASTTMASCCVSPGDTIALSPPLIIKEEQIGEIFEDKLPKLLASI